MLSMKHKESQNKSSTMEVSKTSEVVAKGTKSSVRDLEIATRPSTELDKAKELAREIAKSSLGGHTNEDDALVAILMGKDLGLPPTVALNNIYSIEGRGAMGIHLMTALCLKAGVTYEVLEDFSPLYGVYVKGANNAAQLSRTATLNELKEFMLDGEKAGSDIVDYITRIKLSRVVKRPNGEWKEISFTSEYKLSTAAEAGLLKKANWKYKETMTLNRCLSKGYRAIAADVVFNMQEISELTDALDIPVNVDNTGKVEIIEAETIINNSSDTDVATATEEI